MQPTNGKITNVSNGPNCSSTGLRSSATDCASAHLAHRTPPGSGCSPKCRERAIAGLIPILWTSGTGSGVKQRIAAPMIGGMVTAPLLSMLILPAAYLLLHRRGLRRTSVDREHNLKTGDSTLLDITSRRRRHLRWQGRNYWWDRVRKSVKGRPAADNSMWHGACFACPYHEFKNSFVLAKTSADTPCVDAGSMDCECERPGCAGRHTQ